MCIVDSFGMINQLVVNFVIHHRSVVINLLDTFEEYFIPWFHCVTEDCCICIFVAKKCCLSTLTLESFLNLWTQEVNWFCFHMKTSLNCTPLSKFKLTMIPLVSTSLMDSSLPAFSLPLSSINCIWCIHQ